MNWGTKTIKHLKGCLGCHKNKAYHKIFINSQRAKKTSHKSKHNNTKHKTKHEHQKPHSLLFHHLQSFKSHLEHFRTRVFCLHVFFCSENWLTDLHGAIVAQRRDRGSRVGSDVLLTTGCKWNMFIPWPLGECLLQPADRHATSKTLRLLLLLQPLIVCMKTSTCQQKHTKCSLCLWNCEKCNAHWKQKLLSFKGPFENLPQ